MGNFIIARLWIRYRYTNQLFSVMNCVFSSFARQCALIKLISVNYSINKCCHKRLLQLFSLARFACIRRCCRFDGALQLRLNLKCSSETILIASNECFWFIWSIWLLKNGIIFIIFHITRSWSCSSNCMQNHYLNLCFIFFKFWSEKSGSVCTETRRTKRRVQRHAPYE